MCKAKDFEICRIILEEARQSDIYRCVDLAKQRIFRVLFVALCKVSPHQKTGDKFTDNKSCSEKEEHTKISRVVLLSSPEILEEHPCADSGLAGHTRAVRCCAE